ncbi:sigma-70 family RNA polymerase sigma factor [Blautia schinkii]|nr:sigma-70 family RNA polymerase sigma factor [Blautia schinkii]
MLEILIRKAKKGDADAFCELMELQMQSMYKVARAYLNNNEDVADAVQDTILTCFEKLQTLEHNRYFKTWMTRILINKCKDILQARSRMMYTDNLPETPVYEEDFEALEWDNVLAPVDEKYRTVLLLYYMEGFNTREISEILNLKESTVKSRLQRGRRKVSQEYFYKVKEGQA